MSEETLRFYLDEHVDVEIARQLNLLGIDTVTVRDLKLRGEDDPIQLQVATDQGRVLCTMDRHFLEIAASGVNHSGIAFIPSENSEIGVIVTYLALMAKVVSADEARNRVEFMQRLA